MQALLYPDQPDLEATEWERFHRSEAAFRASLNESEASKELFSVARALSQLFGCGSGRVLLRCIQAFDSDSSAPAAAQMSGTRQGEAITRIAENLVRNYRTYSLALHARIFRKQQGHGSQPLSNLLGVGRRLLSADFLIYLLLLKDLMMSQRRFVLKIQFRVSMGS